jgi:hypothetical protein
MAETNTGICTLEVGCLTLVPESRGAAGPADTTHFVQGWEPVCGSQRVRFVFPGRGHELGATCPDCVHAVAVPRPRTPAKPRARKAS